MLTIETTRDRAEHLLRALQWLCREHNIVADGRTTSTRLDRLAHGQCKAVLELLILDVRLALTADDESAIEPDEAPAIEADSPADLEPLDVEKALARENHPKFP